jgi:hypothetical protein
MNMRLSLVVGVVAALVAGSAATGLALEKPKIGAKPAAKSGGASASGDSAESEDGAQFALNDNSQTVTHDCKGGQAAINGNKNTLHLKNCATTAINGNNNTIDVTGVETLAVVGNDNVVSYHGKPGGNAPTVSDVGSRNKVSGK